MTIWKTIGTGHIAPEPTIKIKSPTLFNMCLAATGNPDRLIGRRKALGYLHIDPAAKRLTGADGFMLVSADALDFCAWQGVKSLLIRPARKLPYATQNARINISRMAITGWANGQYFDIPCTLLADDSYPKITGVLEIIKPENRVPVDQIRLNPTFLRRLQKATPMKTDYPVITACCLDRAQEPQRVVYAVTFPGCMTINHDYTAVIMPFVS